MRKIILCLLLTFAWTSFSFAAIPTETVASVVKITHKNASVHVHSQLADGVNFGTVDLTVSPLGLGWSHGKGIELQDSSGKRIVFAIDDGFSAMIFDYAIGEKASTNDFPIKIGKAYRFILHVSELGIIVNRVTDSGVEYLFQYPVALQAPLHYELVTQGTGAVFTDVLVKANK